MAKNINERFHRLVYTHTVFLAFGQIQQQPDNSPLSLLRLLQSISRGPFHLLFNVVFSNDDDVYHPVIDSCWLYKTQPCPRWTVLIYFASCRDGYLNRHCCIILTDSSIFDFSRFRGNQSTRYQTTEGNGRRQQQWEATDAGHVPGYRTDQPLRPKSYVIMRHKGNLV
ncbi:hypothetical protein OUZ56_003875 [Daphnia magna]|uniref:Uncharacterized protein n=1 Tax=Daphnia magna TaxID=35525 RepID=A0ABQ9YN19_9CRUS|nr:hypothetical protein OUZ56_003875 [Daphnia magna]